MNRKSPRIGRSSSSISSPKPIELLESRTMLSASLHAQTITPTEPVVALVASKATATRAANGTDAKGTFTVSRSHFSTKLPLTVNYSIDSASTAANGVDFTAIPGSIVIPAGHGSATISINPLNSAAALAVEKITLDLQNGSYTENTAKSAATVTISDKRALVSIAATQPTAQESGLVAGQYTVTRTGSTQKPLTVSYTIDPTSTATSGVDFAPLTGTVVIAKKQTQATIALTPIDAGLFAGSKNVILDLSSGSYGTLRGGSSATVSIADNDPAPVVDIATLTNASDVNPTGAGLGQFTVTRTGDTSKAATITYVLSTADTALPGVDFAALPGSVVIPAGQSSANINVTATDLGVATANKTLTLTLTNSGETNPSLITATMTIAEHATIVAPVVDISTLSNASDVDPDGAGLGQFQVTRTGDTTNALTVNYVLSNTGTAVSGVDFTALPGSIVIPAGQSSAIIDVTAIDAGLVTANKTLTVTLTNSGETNTSLITATMTIAEHAGNVTPVVDVSKLTDASEVDPTTTGLGQFQVTRQGSTAADLTVNYTVSGTAVAGTNYVALSGSVVIPAGQSSATITLTPINDNLADGATTVILTLTNTGETNPSLSSATMSIADAGASTVPDGWWDTDFHDRVAIQANVGNFARTDMPVDQAINFTTLLSTLGQSGQPLNLNSLRVVETSADGTTVIDPNVPFQFDQAAGFDATNNAAGDLVFILSGSTAANATRYYHVYFDTGANFTAETITPLISTNTNTTDQGQAAIEIDTVTADYFLQTQNGGFSTILDKDGNNWIGYNDVPNSMGQGQYRGIPNAVVGGGFHPGFTDGTTTVVSTGPLKTTLLCTCAVDLNGDGQLFNYTMMYEIYPTFVRATMLSADANYWFLYEGTPGGSINNNDLVGQSNGTVINENGSFIDQHGLNATGTGEWAYFDSVGENRILYEVKNNPSDQIDSYYAVDLTIFGLGRDNSQSGNARMLFTGQNSFTFGLADTDNTFNTASTIINGEYQPVTLTSSSTPQAIQ